MHDSVLQKIFCLFKKERIKLIIHYGNLNGRDIDIFIILKDNIDYNCIKTEKLDITFVGLSQAHIMAKNFDPLLIEPIMLGNIIYGNKKEIVDSIRNNKNNKEISKYLRNKSKTFLAWAIDHLNKQNFYNACDCIRFSISFYCFSVYYNKNKKIIYFNNLKTLFREEFFLIYEAEMLAKKQKKFSILIVNDLLIKNQKLLTS